MTISFKRFISEDQLHEMHDRYMRAHGKKASGQGRWSFTTARSGDDGKTYKHDRTDTVSNAAKAAKKALGTNKVYVMESSELEELTQREKEMIAQRKARRAGGRLKKKGAAPAKKKSTAPAKPTQKKTATVGNTRDGSDTHVVMQLRKAQDVDGNYDIKVGPNKTVRLKKGQIDNLLKVHDKLQKPDQKRKFRVDLIKKLRKM